MGRKYDLTGVAETQFISEAGEYTLKVINVVQDKTANFNDVEKVIFQTKEALQISDDFVVTDKALWKMKLFTKALKLPTVTDTDEWVGRYVKATVGLETYEKDGQLKQKCVITKYAESNLTNTLPPRALSLDDEAEMVF